MRLALTVTLLSIATTLPAQSIASRVARVTDGTVRMSFAARPGICGRGTTIHHGDRNRTTWGDYRATRDVEWDAQCDEGPIRLVVDVRDREPAALRVYVGGRWRPAGGDVTDLGTVPARDAADYLVSLAATGMGKVARDAVFPATLAADAVVWPALIRIARDERRPRETRTQAVFWLGQAAGEAATAGLRDIVDDDVDREVRKSAIFALSQRPRDEGIPALIRIARSNRDPALRKDAIFWLAQSGDPRAVDLLEEMLRK